MFIRIPETSPIQLPSSFVMGMSKLSETLIEGTDCPEGSAIEDEVVPEPAPPPQPCNRNEETVTKIASEKKKLWFNGGLPYGWSVKFLT